MVLTNWARSEHAECWSACKVHTVCFFPAPNVKWARELLSMDQCRIRRVIGAITGHCGVGKHLAKMELTSEPNSTCGFEEDNSSHG